MYRRTFCRWTCTFLVDKLAPLYGTTLLTYLFTYLLTPRSRFLLEKLTNAELVKKFPAFYGTQRFITAFTSAPPPFSILSQLDLVHTPHITSWRSMLILTGTTAAVATLKKPHFLCDCHSLLQVLTFLLSVHILRSVFTINLSFSYIALFITALSLHAEQAPFSLFWKLHYCLAAGINCKFETLQAFEIMQVIFFSLLLFWFYCFNKYFAILQIWLLVIYLDPNLMSPFV